MARTQSVYYRDSRGTEPVNEFIQALPPKRAAKIDDFVEEYLNGQPPEAPPPAFPITSQIDGELRELRVRFATTRYRILYQRSETWWCSCTRWRRTPERSLRLTLNWPSSGRSTSSAGWTPSGAGRHGPIPERRYELDLTQQEVARRAGTSHSFISKLESGEHIPTIPVLNRIVAVLDEQLLIGIERKAPGQEPEREIAPAPESMSA